MRRRLQSTTKWGCTVLTVLLLLVWITSRWFYVGASVAERGSIYVCWGCLSIAWELPWDDPRGALEVGAWKEMPHFIWWFGYRASITPALSIRRVDVPLWSLATLVAIPAGLLCYRARLAPGLCRKCGYDLRGGTTGVCPECGAETNHKAELPA